MKPNPFVSLLTSRKVIISIGALVLVAAISVAPWLTDMQKTTAVGAVTALAWKLIHSTALEDVGKSAAGAVVDAAKVTAAASAPAPAPAPIPANDVLGVLAEAATTFATDVPPKADAP